jgi:pimeloyl-ACP methyl ester carboxylesterase
MKDLRFITLPVHRSLAYAVYGDPGGKPVFFFHGMPGSRFFRPADEITTRLGVRLICVDRPGYGGSTFQDGRRILDFPKDILTLADYLGIDRFTVAGHSGGGPYVAACAFVLPGRVTKAAILSGAGPIETPGATRSMSGINRFGFMAGRFLPWPLWRLLIGLVFSRRASDPAADLARGDGQRPVTDDELLRQSAIRQACIQSEVEAFRSGLRGIAWEARLLTRPWGFPLESIRIPVHLWQGSMDDLATLPMAQYIAGKIPGSRLTICDGEAHLLLFPHWKEILSVLTTE